MSNSILSVDCYKFSYDFDLEKDVIEMEVSIFDIWGGSRKEMVYSQIGKVNLVEACKRLRSWYTKEREAEFEKEEEIWRECCEDRITDTDVDKEMPVVRRGRKPLTVQYPQLVTVVHEYVQQNKIASLTEIRQHVLTNVPDLKTISKTTIRRIVKGTR